MQHPPARPRPCTPTTAPCRYRLTSTLVLPNASGESVSPDFVGEGGAILQQDNVSADIVFGSAVHVWRASGLQFAGGRNQLHIGNNNTDKGGITIVDCGFHHASSAAIRLLEPSRELQPPNVGKSTCYSLQINTTVGVNIDVF